MKTMTPASISILAMALVAASAGLNPAAATPPPPGKCVTRTQTVTSPQGLKYVCKVKLCDGVGLVSRNCYLPGTFPALPGANTRLRGGATLVPSGTGTTAP
jgi:hypothetical protein